MTLKTWLSEPLPPEVDEALARLARTEDVERVAVMPDVHLAEDVCVGTIVGTRTTLLPAAVGGDIGCGMAAIRFEGGAELLEDERVAAKILGGLYERIPTLRHETPVELPVELAETPLSDLALERLKRRDGALQLGTLGRGNHFVELQSDDEGWLWLMLHSGSRAMGQAIRDRHLRDAGTTATGLRFLRAEESAGQAYLSDLDWAIRYADASRRAMVAAASEIVSEALGIDADAESFIACHHNHVIQETHGGETLWVHRKGAIAAASGQRGIIPGSMGSESYHVEGRGQAEALGSASHGAGRAMSRSDARRRIPLRTFEREMRGVWYDHRLSSNLRDEAPSAYKDVREVMRAQHDLVRIVRVLRPLLAYKGV